MRLSLEDPVVITCAISGALEDREQCPAIPYTPEVEDFRAITQAIRAEVGDEVIVNYSTGAVGIPLDKRIAYLRELRPEVAALKMGSMNYAKYSRSRRDVVFKAVFENSFDDIVALLTAMNELGIKPEHECFDVGHVGSLAPLIHMGVLHEPLHVDCVMGVVGGAPPTPRNLVAKARQMTQDVGRRPATVSEARELLGVPERELTRREMLTGEGS
jgi:uncharacterized protein (DUF849 family)